MHSMTGLPPSPSDGVAMDDGAVMERAGAWWARVQADDAADADHAACAAWRAQHPDHERAWQQLQAFDQQWAAVPRSIAQQVLGDLHEQREQASAQTRTRRQLLGLAIVVPGVAAAAYLGRRSNMWQMAWADARTNTGEIRTVVLDDGSQIVLGSASAVDVVFTASERRLILRRGHIMVTTAVDPVLPARPLLVQTPHGSARAIGTRFAVTLKHDFTCLEVFQGAVVVHPDGNASQSQQIDAGHATHFNARSAGTPHPLDAGADGWTKGMLSVSDMRLADVVERLAQYRSGVLRCDPAIADLRVTGVFPLHAPDRALHNLTLGLPIRLQYRTRYWVTLVPQ